MGYGIKLYDVFTGFHEGIEKELSTYFEKTIHEDGSVLVEQVSNPYF